MRYLSDLHLAPDVRISGMLRIYKVRASDSQAVCPGADHQVVGADHARGR